MANEINKMSFLLNEEKKINMKFNILKDEKENLSIISKRNLDGNFLKNKNKEIEKLDVIKENKINEDEQKFKFIDLLNIIKEKIGLIFQLNDNLIEKNKDKINNRIIISPNEFYNNYIIDVNKYHKEKNGIKIIIPNQLKNYISTSKYTWYNFFPKILYEQFSKMTNIYFIIIAILQCFPEISNSDGKPIILMPLLIVTLINSIKDFYEDWKRKKSDDDENNREVEVFDLDQKQFVITKWKDIFVGNIIKIKKDEYFPADCILISSSDRKTHNCFIETKNLDGETNLKIKKSINNFVERCKDLSTFQGKLVTQMPNEYIYEFDAVFEFDSEIYKDKNNHINIPNNNEIKININKYNEENNKNNILNNINLNELNSNKLNYQKRNEDVNINESSIEIKEEDYSDEDKESNRFNKQSDIEYFAYNYLNRKNKFSDFQQNNNDDSKRETIIIGAENFLLRGCSLRQTESVLCFVVYTGKNTKIMQNSPGARSKTSSLEKRMNQQIKYIFLFQILLSLTASFFSLIQIIILRRDPTPYLYINQNDHPFNFEEYANMFYIIFSKDNLKKIFNQKEGIFLKIKLFIKEISQLINLPIISFLMIKLGTWCVLMNNLVPISLLMTLELVKYFQGWFISWDVDIYDRNKKVMAKVQTSTLNEELGQVRYIFSDKTGTLTKNHMNFKRVTIGYNQYNKMKEDEFESSTSLLEYVNEGKKEQNKEQENNNKNYHKSNSGNELKINNEEISYDINHSNSEEINYDDYGVIKNISFLDDEQFKKDLRLIIQDDNIDKDNNKNVEDNLIEDNINNKLLDSSEDDENENITLKTNENISNKDISSKLSQDNYLDLFMTAITTCHSGIINQKEFESNKKLIYQALSPDEIAILNFARKYKYIFFGRNDNKITIEKPEIINNKVSSKKIIYKILIEFEYSSERKSMSAIVQNMENLEEIYLFMKGADNVILNKIDKKNKNNQKIMKNIENALDLYSKEGLRILTVAYKKLSLNELDLYQNEYLKAVKSIINKKENLEILAKKIEKDLILLGVTGIQDELQDNVYETLKDFSEAGIKLWVLTGDKRETAKSIAFSCGLFEEEFNIFEIKEGLNKIQLELRLNELVEEFNNIVDRLNSISSIKIETIKAKSKDSFFLKNNNKSNNKNEKEILIKSKFGLVISSDELNILALNYELEVLFYELASRCDSVLCCRVTPIQKAKMVHLIQRFSKIQEHKGSNYYKYLIQNDLYQNFDEKNNIVGPLKDSVTTLAIGDGANDVNMITSAHIGVGIIGIEGKQAERASDYAIGEFKFLKKLLFFHGHESLRKNSFIIFYNFYKNFLFVMPLFFVGFYSVFSGQTIYDPWLYQLYNLAFTVLPIIWFGIYDSERTTTESMNNPKYYYNLNQKMFNNWKFWEWIFYGIIQGYFVFFFIFSSNNIYSSNENGEIQDFKSSGAMVYSIVIIIANFKVFQETSLHGFISIFFLIISIAVYYLLIYLMNNYYKMFYFGTFWRFIKNYRYYLIIICLSCGLAFVDGGLTHIQKIFFYSDKKVKYNKIMVNIYKERKKRKKKNKKKNEYFEKVKINDNNKHDNLI